VRRIQLEILAEKVKSSLALAGLPLSPLVDAELANGAYVEIDDEDDGSGAVYLQWRVHPVLQRDFVAVPQSALETDPRARLYRHSLQVMLDAMSSVLVEAGFVVRAAAHSYRPFTLEVSEQSSS
jgi:hypothetical protein